MPTGSQIQMGQNLLVVMYSFFVVLQDVRLQPNRTILSKSSFDSEFKALEFG